jgi:hypothetical protein
MAQRLGLVMFIVALSATGQTPSELYRHFRDVQSTSEGVQLKNGCMPTSDSRTPRRGLRILQSPSSTPLAV